MIRMFAARHLMSEVRRGLGWLRTPRFWAVAGAVSFLALLGLTIEAAVRARITPPLERVPTALYTRPTPWGDRDPSGGEAVLIGRLDQQLAEYRIPVTLADLPDRLIQAVLAVEDQRFFEHSGLDLRRIAGAAVANVKSGGIRQGGSTITQQLAKNLYLSHRRTPLRKLREATFALVLEERYDKRFILEAYLNEVYLGQANGDAIHGVGAAAQYYFGKEIGRITLGEAALLAGMIRAPNRTTPIRHAAAARSRRDLVLDLMRAQERISGEQARRAGRETIRTRPAARPAVDAPYFRDLILSALPKEARRTGARGGFVLTTLDPALQRAANRAVREGLGRLRSSEVQAALVALDPRTGEVLAMVGGREYGVSQFNRAVQARRQPGSAFKPIVALAALGRNGGDEPSFTLASVVRDEPIRVSTPAGEWVPANYDRNFRGPVTVREAMEQSLNVPFVRMGLEVGPERIAATAARLGVESRLQPVPSLALGASEVTLLELTRAYGTLAAGGYRAEPRMVLGVADASGQAWSVGREEGRQVVDPAEAYLVTSALEGVISDGTGRGLAQLGSWGGLAGKSGTSNDWRDGWFLAYTPNLVVGVWVGHDDGKSLGLTGSGAALPIVSRFLREALDGKRRLAFPVPDGVEFGWAGTAGTDEWVSWECGGRQEVYLRGTAPRNPCGWLEEGRGFVRRLLARLFEGGRGRR